MAIQKQASSLEPVSVELLHMAARLGSRASTRLAEVSYRVDAEEAIARSDLARVDKTVEDSLSVPVESSNGSTTVISKKNSPVVDVSELLLVRVRFRGPSEIVAIPVLTKDRLVPISDAALTQSWLASLRTRAAALVYLDEYSSSSTSSTSSTRKLFLKRYPSYKIY